MNVWPCRVAYADHRGRITDLVDAEIAHVALIETDAGHVRGNHYHRTAVAYVYVLRGMFSVRCRLHGDPPEATSVAVATGGDLVTIYPMEVHSLLALEDGAFLMMTDRVQHGDETVREDV